jgi:hypothetical protein
LVSVPRLLLANFVNFFAAFRATRIYIGHRATGKLLVWDKTAHSYPVKLQRDAHRAHEGSPAVVGLPAELGR